MSVLVRIGVAWFEWDAEKSDSNQAKHGVSFGEAAQVFEDPLLRFIGRDDDEGEERDTVIGWSALPRLMLVVHTERHGNTRIISARGPTPAERRLYEEP